MSFLLFQHADVLHKSERRISTAEMQRTLMFSFFALIEEQKFKHLVTMDVHSPICGDPHAGLDTWRGIACVDSKIMKVQYSREYISNLQLAFLPSSVERIYITYSGQTYPIDTRQLPRALIHFNMCSNEIFGQFDVNTLPSGLLACNISMNAIRGPMHFIHLPRQLCELNMSSNPLSMKRVYFRDIPSSLKQNHIQLHSCNVQKVVPLDPFQADDSTFIDLTEVRKEIREDYF